MGMAQVSMVDSSNSLSGISADVAACAAAAAAVPSAVKGTASVSVESGSGAAPVSPNPLHAFPISPIPDCTELVLQLVSPWSFGLARFLADSLDPYLHSATSEFIAQLSAESEFSVAELVGLRVYTDGAGGLQSKDQPGPPAWAFAVFGVAKDGRECILGYLASPAAEIVSSGKYKEPAAPSEFYAALWFVLWLLQSPQYHHLPVLVLTDNRMVVDTARGG